MKTLLLLSLILFCLASCEKEEAIPPKTTTPFIKKIKAAVNRDTIPDKAAFKVKLLQDSTDGDETLLVFNHLASPKYSSSGDAPYFAGFGKVSLASMSADGVDLAINEISYTANMFIGLDVHTRTNGTYMLKISYESKIPPNVQIWLKDAYRKDSINMCSGNYSFNVTKADTNSFGKSRFSLLLKDTNHQ